MNKSDLLRVLKGRCQELQPSDVELARNCLLEHLVSALESGERIEIRGFGCFNLHHHPPRIGRHPKTGVAVKLPAKVKLHFKPSKDMKDRVNATHDKYTITD